MDYWQRMSLGTAAVGFLLLYKAPLVRYGLLTQNPHRVPPAGHLGPGRRRRVLATQPVQREHVGEARYQSVNSVMFCYKRYIMTKNLHPRKKI